MRLRRIPKSRSQRLRREPCPKNHLSTTAKKKKIDGRLSKLPCTRAGPVNTRNSLWARQVASFSISVRPLCPTQASSSPVNVVRRTSKVPITVVCDGGTMMWIDYDGDKWWEVLSVLLAKPLALAPTAKVPVTAMEGYLHVVL